MNLSNKDYRSEFIKQGYLHFNDALEQSQISKVKNEVISVFGSIFNKNNMNDVFKSNEEFEENVFKLFIKNHNDYLSTIRAVQHIYSIYEILSSEEIKFFLKLIGLVQPAIAARPILYMNNKKLSKEEFHYKVPAHQDWRSMQGSLNSVVVWIPLVDVTLSMGAIELVPRSHLGGLLPSEKDNWYRHIPNGITSDMNFESVEVKAGDLIIFNQFLVHRSGNNITDKIRWSIQFRFNDLKDETFISRSLPYPSRSYIPPDELITPNFPKIDDIISSLKMK